MATNKFISVCYVTCQAEDFLSESISSIYDFADQIIIIDNDSTDRTKEIVHSFPQNKIYFESRKFGDGSFTKENLNRIKTEQRNRYLALAKSKWLVICDDDEVFKKTDLKTLYNLMNDERKFMSIRYFSVQFWKDFDHIITGPHWDNSQERCFRNLLGLNYNQRHCAVSIGNEFLARKYGKDNLNRIYWCKNKEVQLFHYGMVKPVEKIKQKIRTYMYMDNPAVDEENLERFVNLHPYFSGRFNQPRHGPKGLWIAGVDVGQREQVLSWKEEHPETMKNKVEKFHQTGKMPWGGDSDSVTNPT